MFIVHHHNRPLQVTYIGSTVINALFYFATVQLFYALRKKRSSQKLQIVPNARTLLFTALVLLSVYAFAQSPCWQWCPWTSCLPLPPAPPVKTLWMRSISRLNRGSYSTLSGRSPMSVIIFTNILSSTKYGNSALWEPHVIYLFLVPHSLRGQGSKRSRIWRKKSHYNETGVSKHRHEIEWH